MDSPKFQELEQESTIPNYVTESHHEDKESLQERPVGYISPPEDQQHTYEHEQEHYEAETGPSFGDRLKSGAKMVGLGAAAVVAAPAVLGVAAYQKIKDGREQEDELTQEVAYHDDQHREVEEPTDEAEVSEPEKTFSPSMGMFGQSQGSSTETSPTKKSGGLSSLFGAAQKKTQSKFLAALQLEKEHVEEIELSDEETDSEADEDQSQQTVLTAKSSEHEYEPVTSDPSEVVSNEPESPAKRGFFASIKSSARSALTSMKIKSPTEGYKEVATDDTPEEGHPTAPGYTLVDTDADELKGQVTESLTTVTESKPELESASTTEVETDQQKHIQDHDLLRSDSQASGQDTTTDEDRPAGSLKFSETDDSMASTAYSTAQEGTTTSYETCTTSQEMYDTAGSTQDSLTSGDYFTPPSRMSEMSRTTSEMSDTDTVTHTLAEQDDTETEDEFTYTAGDGVTMTVSAEGAADSPVQSDRHFTAAADHTESAKGRVAAIRSGIVSQASAELEEIMEQAESPAPSPTATKDSEKDDLEVDDVLLNEPETDDDRPRSPIPPSRFDSVYGTSSPAVDDVEETIENADGVIEEAELSEEKESWEPCDDDTHQLTSAGAEVKPFEDEDEPEESVGYMRTAAYGAAAIGAAAVAAPLVMGASAAAAGGAAVGAAATGTASVLGSAAAAAGAAVAGAYYKYTDAEEATETSETVVTTEAADDEKTKFKDDVVATEPAAKSTEMTEESTVHDHAVNQEKTLERSDSQEETTYSSPTAIASEQTQPPSEVGKLSHSEHEAEDSMVLQQHEERTTVETSEQHFEHVEAADKQEAKVDEKPYDIGEDQKQTHEQTHADEIGTVVRDSNIEFTEQKSPEVTETHVAETPAHTQHMFETEMDISESTEQAEPKKTLEEAHDDTDQAEEDKHDSAESEDAEEAELKDIIEDKAPGSEVELDSPDEPAKSIPVEHFVTEEEREAERRAAERREQHISTESLDRQSVKSGGSGKRYSTSRRSSASSVSHKSSHEESPVYTERLTPDITMKWQATSEATSEQKLSQSQPISPREDTQLITHIESPEESKDDSDDFVHVEEGLTVPQEDSPSLSHSDEDSPVLVEPELETLHEEPEDEARSSIGGSLTRADTLAILGQMRKNQNGARYASSDNMSESSLQEFERLEREMALRGEGSLSSSEMELLMNTVKRRSSQGSLNSLTEFERLEREVTGETAERAGSSEQLTTGEESAAADIMLLSDIHEESEPEDMSTRDDEESVKDIMETSTFELTTEMLLQTPDEEHKEADDTERGPTPTDKAEEQSQSSSTDKEGSQGVQTPSRQPDDWEVVDSVTRTTTDHKSVADDTDSFDVVTHQELAESTSLAVTHQQHDIMVTSVDSLDAGGISEISPRPSGADTDSLEGDSRQTAATAVEDVEKQECDTDSLQDYEVVDTDIQIEETDQMNKSTDSLEEQMQATSTTGTTNLMMASMASGGSSLMKTSDYGGDNDSVLDPSCSQDAAMVSSQETHGQLSCDTTGTYQEYGTGRMRDVDEADRDSLTGPLEDALLEQAGARTPVAESMPPFPDVRDEHGNLTSTAHQRHQEHQTGQFPMTLTTYQSSQMRPDGSIQVITRTVRTRVTDPVVSEVKFTGTESQDRIQMYLTQMDQGSSAYEEFESIDDQGNTTKTTVRRFSQAEEASDLGEFPEAENFTFRSPDQPDVVVYDDPRMTTSTDSLDAGAVGISGLPPHQPIAHAGSTDSLNQ